MSSDKEYVFKVALKGTKRIFRAIALRGDQTLEDLHEAIFAAFNRYDEHLYSFYFPKAPTGRATAGPIPREYTAPQLFEGLGTLETEVEDNIYWVWIGTHAEYDKIVA